MRSKIISLLGFAAKAGKLGFGFEASVTSLKARKAKLVITACDISLKSSKEISFYATKSNITHITLKGIDIKAVSDAVGRKCGIISVNDSGFADSILAAYKQDEQESSDK